MAFGQHLATIITLMFRANWLWCKRNSSRISTAGNSNRPEHHWRPPNEHPWFLWGKLPARSSKCIRRQKTIPSRPQPVHPCWEYFFTFIKSEYRTLNDAHTSSSPTFILPNLTKQVLYAVYSTCLVSLGKMWSPTGGPRCRLGPLTENR